MLRIFLPARCEANHECIQCSENWVDATAAHAGITDFLKFLKVCALVTQLTILEAK